MALYKIVACKDGSCERVMCSPEEEAAIRAEWAANEADSRVRRFSRAYLAKCVMCCREKRNFDATNLLLYLLTIDVVREDDAALRSALDAVKLSLDDLLAVEKAVDDAQASLL